MSVTKEQEIERLTQLIRVMRGLSRHERRRHFDIRQWGMQTDCGTTMCAAGFCGSDPWFRRRGFKLEPTFFEKMMIRYRGISSWDALYAFFGDGLGYAGMSHPIFGTPQTVGEVIRAARKRIKELES